MFWASRSSWDLEPDERAVARSSVLYSLVHGLPAGHGLPHRSSIRLRKSLWIYGSHVQYTGPAFGDATAGCGAALAKGLSSAEARGCAWVLLGERGERMGEAKNPEQWGAVDQFFVDRLVAQDVALEEALKTSHAAGLPLIHVAPNQGKMLQLLAKLQGARTILEIGTLGGYSTIWLARALPEGGRLVTLEAEPKHAEVARTNLARAGLSEVVELRLGPALETLPALAAEGAAPFDFIFIDADKPNNPGYFEWTLKLARVGSLIIIDNVVRDGKVADGASQDLGVQGSRRAIELMAAEPRVTATAIQTVGSKGYDGFAMAIVTS